LAALGLVALTVLIGDGLSPALAWPEPRLVLPGDRVVHAGQWIDLRWTPADSVSELEILLSLDGGRHYSLCVSPPLDPKRGCFSWHVPAIEGRALKMRIRFNRGGREIEGAPTAPFFVGGSDRGGALPLGLPPLDPAGQHGATRSREGPGPLLDRSEASEESGSARLARARSKTPQLAPPSPVDPARAIVWPAASPFTPLRP
jgi:hypothetical protein